MTKFQKCLKIFPMNKRNEKVQNIPLSGIGYRVSGIEPNYIITTIRFTSTTRQYFLQLLLVYFLNWKNTGFLRMRKYMLFYRPLERFNKILGELYEKEENDAHCVICRNYRHSGDDWIRVECLQRR